MIFALCVVLAVLSLKYQDKFETWLVNKFSGRKKSGAEEAETKDGQKNIQDSKEE